jgi:RNA polymerase sigma-70 factor (ECF subfamily)
MDEEKELVHRAIHGDKEAFEMIIREYERPLLNYIGRMVREHELALEFTQEVFIRAYSSLQTFNPQYKFSTWIFKIASNLLIDHWRKKKLDAFSLDQKQGGDDDGPSLQLPAEEPSVIHKFEVSELREKVEKVLKNIPPSLREVFVWRHVNEFSYEEISEIKSLPVGTVKNRVFQAKELIRRLLTEEL